MDIVREAEILAKIACVVETHMCKMTKQADGELTPGLKGSLIGGLGGAAVGGVGNLMLRRYLERKHGLKKEPAMGHAALGALLGGLTGAGGGYLLGNKGITTPDDKLKFKFTSNDGTSHDATVAEYNRNMIAHNNQVGPVGALTGAMKAVTPDANPVNGDAANTLKQVAYPAAGAATYWRSKGDTRGLSRGGKDSERMTQVAGIQADKTNKDTARVSLRSSGEKARDAAARINQLDSRLVRPLTEPRLSQKDVDSIQDKIYNANSDRNTHINSAREAIQKIKTAPPSVGTSAGRTAMQDVMSRLAAKGVTTSHPAFESEFLKEWHIQNRPWVGAAKAGIKGDIAGQGIRMGSNVIDLIRAYYNNTGNVLHNRFSGTNQE